MSARFDLPSIVQYAFVTGSNAFTENITGYKQWKWNRVANQDKKNLTVLFIKSSGSLQTLQLNNTVKLLLNAPFGHQEMVYL